VIPSAVVAAGAAPPQADDGEVIVRARAVGRRFPGGRGVGPLDIDVMGGEVLAIMGPNGAGKSTLLRILASADRPQTGRLTWWGGRAPGPARRRIGYAADEPAEESTLSPRQSTYFWCRQWVAGAVAARTLTDEALAAVGLEERADEPVGSLSYGLRRRLALAQALVHRPALALLDEPSAGLDPDGVSLVADMLRRRCAEGRATVIASNDPELVTLVADRVAMLIDGSCLRLAPLDVLLGEVPRLRVVDLRVGEGAAPAVARRAGALPGTTVVSVAGGDLVLEIEDGVSLRDLVGAAESAGPAALSIEVRRPDLRDCFRALSGAEVPATLRS
jgi:ABC-2 type transport system ATP-binding protein